MLPSTSLVLGLRIADFGFSVAAGIWLYRSSLYRHYRILFAYLCFHVARSLALFVSRGFPHPNNAYAWTWVVTEPLNWLVYVLLVVELFSLVLQNYKGLQTVGRWMFFTAVPLAIVISGASVVPSWRNPVEHVPVVFYYALIERGVVFSLVIFILLILFFLSWYPIPLGRNIVVHSSICTLYFLSGSLGFLVRNIRGDAATRPINVVLQIITIGCWLAWLTLLTPKGETTTVVVRRQWTDEEEQRLVDQLTAINSSLLRATRR